MRLDFTALSARRYQRNQMKHLRGKLRTRVPLYENYKHSKEGFQIVHQNYVGNRYLYSITVARYYLLYENKNCSLEINSGFVLVR